MTCVRWLTPSERVTSISTTCKRTQYKSEHWFTTWRKAVPSLPAYHSDYDLDDFLGLIAMTDLEPMTAALVSVMGGDKSQKKAKASR